MAQTILLIHDDAAFAKVVQNAFLESRDGSFVIEWVRRCAKGLVRLSKDGKAPIAAVLSNLFLPDSEGIETFDKVFRISPHIPILVLSSSPHENIAKQAIQRGAQDYILEDNVDNAAIAKAVCNMVARAANTEALFIEKERAQVTLNSIADAVACTDAAATITFLNPIAETMTGWRVEKAIGRPFSEVFQIIGINRQRIVNPMALVMRGNVAASLAAGCVLIRPDGSESVIEDSVAPIHDRRGDVTGAVMVFHDVTKVRAMSQKMSYLAEHDYLTDLPNRMLLNDRLSQAIIVAHRQHQPLAVLFVDVDRFKHINDSFGHMVGDKLLVSVAKRLVASVRDSDTVSRQGGDEFIILLSTVAHAEDAALSAQKILTALGLPHRVEQHDLQITLSVGISVYPDDGNDVETLVRNADVAMLQAKERGRNNYQFFKPRMNEHALERQSLESGLRYALKRQEFVLHYQPKINLRTKTLTGAEALIRWRNPQQGVVFAKDFIPLAEQCGYVVQIGRWVLGEGCRQSRCWLDAGLAPIPVAINISAVELRANNFVESVHAVLEDTGLDPSYLELELTETVLMQDPDSTATVLRALKDLGVRLTLDDFGTGYSSLSLLKRFPIDGLKVDKSFVRGLCTDVSDASIVNAVIDLGRNFHLQVIAEGVETREQFLALQAQSCDEGQGYYFGAAIAADEFARLLGAELPTAVFALSNG
jgi:diguanylate cyclase (GGDEF)-like protein/PAS domain S-box-containing protein